MIEERNGAIFSVDRQWRYVLWRVWDESKPPLAVVGLNPSTADETENDPTVRRCLGYARDWGYGSLRMLNVFGYRATDPFVMFDAIKSMNPRVWIVANYENLEYIAKITSLTLSNGGAVLAAWGNHGAWQGQNARVSEVLLASCGEVACLGKTNAGHPKHPLYLRRDARPVPFLGDGGRLCGVDLTTTQFDAFYTNRELEAAGLT